MNARCPENVGYVPVRLMPTTCPRLLTPCATLAVSPGSMPTSTGVCAASFCHSTARMNASGELLSPAACPRSHHADGAELMAAGCVRAAAQQAERYQTSVAP